MSYILNKTDGSKITEIIDGVIDQTTTDLTLIGKNFSSYGEFLNENFIHLLENFSSTAQPNKPITGQLWFDLTDNRLKVYDGLTFRVSGGAFYQNTPPSSISAGDFWIDSVRQQLYFYNGISPVLIGPQYNAQQGTSGFKTVDVLDTSNINHTILLLYISTSLIGIFSKTMFTPAVNISGYSGIIKIGFNASDYAGIKFNTTATRAESLVDSSGTVVTADAFVANNADSAIVGTLSIQKRTPLILGTNSNTEIVVDDLICKINSNSADQNFQINVLHNNQLLPSIHVNTVNQRVGIFKNNPTATLDVNGDVVIQGSLNVIGALTSINTTNLEISDKVILLAKTITPTNNTADGSGISIAAGTDIDKTLTWDLLSLSWTSSESFNLVTGKTYKINNTAVLTSSALGLTITSAPGLSSIGTLTSLQVDNLNVNDTTISYVNNSQANGTIILEPKGTGTVDVSSKKITNLATPTDDNDAVNFLTLYNTVKQQALVVSLDTTGLTILQIASIYLNKLFPPAEHSVAGVNGPICRACCTESGVLTIRAYELRSGVWVYQNDL